MAGRDSAKYSRNAKARRCGVVMGGALGAFVAAAAMATGSAAPANADIDALIDPIIQPILTSLTDSLAGFDPAAAVDLTNWTDSLLASLNSIDLGAALPLTAEPAASAASSTSAAAATSSYDIPLTVNEVTEPTVQATIDGSASQTLLVDTGSSGLVIPYTDLGLTQWFDLGFPTGIGESGYSGGVDYLYLTYGNASVDYGGLLTTPNTPVYVEFLSWPTSSSSPLDFQQFLTDNQVTGILGIGPTGTGPATSPLEAAGYSGVTVNIPGHDLIVGSTNPGTAIGTVGNAPIANLTEVLTTPGAGGTTTSASVSNDVDSGGVYGTIPSSLVGNAGSVPSGSTISVYTSPGGTELYHYITGTDSLGHSTAPTVVSGTSIDSGVEPYLLGPIYINYTADTLTFDNPLPAGYNLP
jgi:hypothetical protein